MFYSFFINCNFSLNVLHGQKNCMIKLTILGTYGNMPDYPPPPSSFLVYTSLALFSFAIPGKRGARQIESSSSTTVTSADFFNPQCQLFVPKFDDSRPHWYRSGTVINQLFPDFRGIRNRGKDVWQILEFNPIVFWYMTGELQKQWWKKFILTLLRRCTCRARQKQTRDAAAFSTLAIAPFWS